MVNQINSVVERLLDRPELASETLTGETKIVIEDLRNLMKTRLNFTKYMQNLEENIVDAIEFEGSGGELDPGSTEGSAMVHPEEGTLVIRIDDIRNGTWMMFKLISGK